jgi:hypothetical protein
MSNEVPEIPEEMQRKFETESRTDFEAHTNEIRRSIEISTSFYEKLSALVAGSIAIAASVAVSISARPGLHSPSLREMSDWFALVIALLWVSLMCAVIHNFVLVRFARAEATYSSMEFQRAILRRGMALAVELTPPQDKVQVQQLEEALHENPHREQARIAKRQRLLHAWAIRLGYISTFSFLAAYTLVVVCMGDVWLINR